MAHNSNIKIQSLQPSVSVCKHFLAVNNRNLIINEISSQPQQRHLQKQII